MIIKDTLSRILQAQGLNSEHISNQNQIITQHYKIKISDLSPKLIETSTPRQIYLNLTFGDQQPCSIQTKCIDISSNVNHFEIQTIKNLTKIEVIQYNSMKKLAKVSLKGVQKQFKYCYEEKSSQISVSIQRARYNLINQAKKKDFKKQQRFQKTVEYNKLSHSTYESIDQKNPEQRMDGLIL